MIQDLERKTEKVITEFIYIEAIFGMLCTSIIIDFLCSLNIHVPTSAMDQC